MGLERSRLYTSQPAEESCTAHSPGPPIRLSASHFHSSPTPTIILSPQLPAASPSPVPSILTTLEEPLCDFLKGPVASAGTYFHKAEEEGEVGRLLQLALIEKEVFGLSIQLDLVPASLPCSSVVTTPSVLHAHLTPLVSSLQPAFSFWGGVYVDQHLN